MPEPSSASAAAKPKLPKVRQASGKAGGGSKPKLSKRGAVRSKQSSESVASSVPVSKRAMLRTEDDPPPAELSAEPEEAEAALVSNEALLERLAALMEPLKLAARREAEQELAESALQDAWRCRRARVAGARHTRARAPVAELDVDDRLDDPTSIHAVHVSW